MEEFLNELLIIGTDVGKRLIGAIIVAILGSIIVKAILKSFKKSKLINKGDTTVAHFLYNFIKIVLYIILVITIVGILGVPLTSFAAIIASAGVTIGLALQGSLSNFAGGIMILIFKPFAIGHYIEAAGNSGTVNDIGIFYTMLTTTDNKEITIPNGTIMASNIVNYSKHDTRRVDLSISVAYGNDPKRICEILLDEANKHDLVLKDPAPFCRLSEHAASSINFALRVWAKSGDYWTVNFDLLESIYKRLADEKIEIPFNQLDVHITQD